MDVYAYQGMIIGKIYKQSAADDIADYFDDGSSSIKCSVYGNDTFVKVKIMDKRESDVHKQIAWNMLY